MTHRLARLALGLAAAAALAAPAFPANAAEGTSCITPKECIDALVKSIQDATCITPLCSKTES